MIRSHFKIRIMAQDRGRIDFQDAGILTYFEDLKIDPDKEIGS
jgi:preprotein translocase subunit Sec61beta